MSAITEWPITDPQFNDTKLITLQKILQVTVAGSGSGGGGSGSGDVQLYTDRDPAAPDNPALTAASFNSATQVITWWPAGGSAWQ